MITEETMNEVKAELERQDGKLDYLTKVCEQIIWAINGEPTIPVIGIKEQLKDALTRLHNLESTIHFKKIKRELVSEQWTRTVTYFKWIGGILAVATTAISIFEGVRRLIN